MSEDTMSILQHTVPGSYDTSEDLTRFHNVSLYLRTFETPGCLLRGFLEVYLGYNCKSLKPVRDRCLLEALLSKSVLSLATVAPLLAAYSTSFRFSFPAIPNPR